MQNFQGCRELQVIQSGVLVARQIQHGQVGKISDGEKKFHVPNGVGQHFNASFLQARADREEIVEADQVFVNRRVEISVVPLSIVTRFQIEDRTVANEFLREVEPSGRYLRCVHQLFVRKMLDNHLMQRFRQLNNDVDDSRLWHRLDPHVVAVRLDQYFDILVQ